MFNPVSERIPIKDMIVTQMEEAILDRKYIPGEKLPTENELCEQFNVSRTSVREAIQVLSARGFVTVEKGRGIFVNRITSESVSDPMEKYLKLRLDRDYIMDLVHARQIIEPAIAREAALNRINEDIEKLEKDIDELSNSKGDYSELADLDMLFHYDLSRATGNIIVPLLLKPLQNLLPEIKPFIYAKVEDAKDAALTWHKKILNAVIERDGDKAFDQMVEHLKIAELHAEKVLNMQNKNK